MLQKLLPAYRVGGTVEGQLQQMHEEIVQLRRELLAARTRNDEIAEQHRRDLVKLKEDVDRRFWLSQRREGETLLQARERVFASYPKAEGIFRQVQLANYELLKRLKSVGDSIGVDLFLLYGTLLGSVRHQGFIPWDDDIDIGVLSEDYDRLKQAVEAHPNLRLDWYYNWDYGTVCPKLKFRDCESFWVDLMLLDSLEVSQENRNERLKEVQQTARKLQEKRLQIVRKYYPEEKPCLIPVRDPRIDAEIQEIREEYRDSLPYYGRGRGKILSMDINPLEIINVFTEEEFYPVRQDQMPFEGGLYTTFQDVDAYLRTIYGEPMDFPPNMLQGVHSSEIAVYLEKDLQTAAEKHLNTKGI